jgi:putative ABC transport system ATP-binding protein
MSTTGKQGPLIDVRNVAKTYTAGEASVRALRGVSLEVGQGEFMSVAGPSGSGKTTLLNLIGCIDRADTGEISIGGSLVSALGRDELALFGRRNLGFVF